MNFISLNFWFFLFIVTFFLLVVRIIFLNIYPFTNQFDRFAIFILSILLLIHENVFSFLVFAYVTGITYWGVYFVRRMGSCHTLLLVIVFLQLSPLFFYKYANFLVNDIFKLKITSLQELVIPLGISFYSFQMIGFTIDSLKENARQSRLLDFLNFASFFPKMIAGPIERKNDLLPQVKKITFRFAPGKFNEGLRWLCLGFYFKLCLADNLLAEFQRSINISSSPFQILISNLLFGLVLYYDFAGYSFIAVGLGKFMNIDLTINFTSPYLASDVVKFWRCWHRSLTFWFRDYVYIPMGGNRTGFWVFNVLIVFVVSGVWHGVGLNFLLWGFFHGMLMVSWALLPMEKVPQGISWIATFFLVSLGWLFFYEADLGRLYAKIGVLASLPSYTSIALSHTFDAWPSFGHKIVFFSITFLSVVTLLIEWLSIRFFGVYYHLLLSEHGCLTMVVLTILLAPVSNNRFIYFNF
jgi:alginate O-acetyltransferase complex protein AlgI